MERVSEMEERKAVIMLDILGLLLLLTCVVCFLLNGIQAA
jgi:hypothetical protein